MVAYYRYYMVKFYKKNKKGKLDEKASKKDLHKGPAGESDKVAEKPRRYKLSQEGLSGRGSKWGRKVHGVREGASGYKPPEGASEEGEDSTQPIDSTRYFETVKGIKSYSEIYEIIAGASDMSLPELAISWQLGWRLQNMRWNSGDSISNSLD